MNSASVKQDAGFAANGDPRSQVDASRRRALLAAALGYADKVRGIVAQVLEHGVIVDAKPDRSLVTNADLAAERAFRDAVEADFPSMGIAGEELEPLRPAADFQWVIDPIDGTAEFARSLPTWGSIIGVFYKGSPLVGIIDHPGLDLRVQAAYGLGAFLNGRRLDPGSKAPLAEKERACIGLPARRNFNRVSNDAHVFDALVRAYPDFRVLCTCLTHTYAATGQLDASVEWDAHLWDLAATRVVIEEAGGRYACVRERVGPGGYKLYCAVFGRVDQVDRIAKMVSAHI